jgi:toxin YoeB
MYKILFSSQTQKDAKKIKSSNLSEKCKLLIELLAQDPFQRTPPFEKLAGNLSGFYLRRINIQHRLVYEVDINNRIVKILRMWTHYE